MGQDASSVDEILFLEARTDSEGRYSFPDIPKGVFDVIYINITPPADEFYMVYSIQRVPEMGVLVNVPDMDVSNKITLTSPKPPRFFRIGEVQNKGIDFAWELSQDTGPVKKQFVGLFEIKDGRLNEIWGMQGGPDLNGALFKGELPQGVTLLPGRDYYLQIGFVREDGMLFTALYEIEFIG